MGGLVRQLRHLNVACWALVSGVLAIVTAVRFRSVITNEWMYIHSGQALVPLEDARLPGRSEPTLKARGALPLPYLRQSKLRSQKDHC